MSDPIILSAQLSRANKTPVNLLISAVLAGVVINCGHAVDHTGDAIIKKYCIECHSGDNPKGGFDFTDLLGKPIDNSNSDLWKLVHEEVDLGYMPPRKKKQLSKSEHNSFLKWIEDKRSRHASSTTNDPGPARLRRLHNDAYDTIIHDIFNQNIKASKLLPVEASSGEGFTNNAEIQTTTPGLMGAYYRAAEFVASHLIVTKAGGITAMPMSVTGTDGRILGLRTQITNLYNKHRKTLIRRGLMAAWMWRHRDILNIKDLTQLSEKMQLNSEYLQMVINQTEKEGKNIFRTFIDSLPQPHSPGGKFDEIWGACINGAPNRDIKSLVGDNNYKKAAETVQATEGKWVNGIGTDPTPTGLDQTLFLCVRRNDRLLMRWADDNMRSELDFYWDIMWECVDTDMEIFNQRTQKIRQNQKPRKKPMAIGHSAFSNINPKGSSWLQRRNSTLQKLRNTKSVIQNQVIEIAEQAWRRPLSDSEKIQLHTQFDSFVSKGTGIEEATRQIVQHILISPYFLYILEKNHKHKDAREVSMRELAFRMSMFLWSSIPDNLLLTDAQNGTLRNPAIRKKHVMRMLSDKRSHALASGFFGQWLGFHRFTDRANPDNAKYPEFNHVIAQSMQRQAEGLCETAIQEDWALDRLLLGDDILLNNDMARFYKLNKKQVSRFPKMKKSVSPFLRLRTRDLIKSSLQGGVLGLSAVHVITSDPLRTSPVKRGVWVLESLLGETPPPPPPDVPSLPEDPVKNGKKSVRQMLEIHRRNPTCASCHVRIDPPGLAMEGFNAVGIYRRKDRNGNKIDDTSTLADGTTLNGINGLRKWLRTKENRWLSNICHRLLGYALARSLLPGDEDLLDKMKDKALTQDLKFSALVIEIIESKQFRFRNSSNYPHTEAINDNPAKQ